MHSPRRLAAWPTNVSRDWGPGGVDHGQHVRICSSIVRAVLWCPKLFLYMRMSKQVFVAQQKIRGHPLCGRWAATERLAGDARKWLENV